ncbi:MAG: uracil-DNA glycosylase [Thermodesulfovibrionales bacterium]|nr:uracil-DNA glycosylase [Thermodesulfovibrionales bacterium]
MNNGIDKPKSLRYPIAIQSRLAGIFAPHISPLTDFVETIRKETGLNREIPYFDPLDGGINAKCLFLFEAPGPRAVYSGFISRNNPDESAKNFFELNHEAGLPRELTISWNVVPWYIGTGTKIRPANKNDIDGGKKYLLDLLSLLPNLRIIVLGGRKAQKAETLIKAAFPDINLIKMPHPSPLFVNNAPENKFKILRTLQAVKEQLLGNKELNRRGSV